jgi:hypothetical protein
VASVPAGVNVIVDGTPYLAPQVFFWAPGSAHLVGTTSPQAVATGTRRVFAGWSDGGAMSHTVNVGAAAATYTAAFTTQHLLTLAAAPAAGGSIAVTPAAADGYYASGTAVQLTAVPINAAWGFVSWSGSLAGGENPRILVMNGTRSVTAAFEILPALSGTISGKTGLVGLRTWTITLTNSGFGTAAGTVITGMTLAQELGAACTPVVLTPFPVVVGTIAPFTSRSAAIAVNFAGCSRSARFTVTIPFSANSGRVNGSIVRFNQFP